MATLNFVGYRPAAGILPLQDVLDYSWEDLPARQARPRGGPGGAQERRALGEEDLAAAVFHHLVGGSNDQPVPVAVLEQIVALKSPFVSHRFACRVQAPEHPRNRGGGK